MLRISHVARTCLITAACLIATVHLPAGEAAEQAIHDRQVAACTAAYAKVTIGDGIDATEARLLANAYFHTFISGCGGVFEVTETASGWSATTLEGRGAEPGPNITIDRASGGMRCTGKPRVTPVATATGSSVEIAR